MSIYKVGFSADSWDFYQAYEAMSDGDTIEFEDGSVYSLEEPFFIKKNIKIVGHFDITDENTILYKSTFSANLIIDNATVDILGLWLEPRNEKPALVVRNGAQVVVNDCQFNFVVSSKRNAILVERRAQLTFNSVYIASNQDAAKVIYINSEAKVILNTSNIITVVVQNAHLEMEQTTVRGYDLNHNTLWLDKAIVHMKNVFINGLPGESNYPVIYSRKSSIISESSLVKRVSNQATIFLCENSSLYSKDDRIDSIKVSESRLILDGSIIEEILQLVDRSYCKLLDFGNSVEIGRINLTHGSTLIGENLILSYVSNPNVWLQNHSYFHVSEITYADGSTGDITYESDNTSVYQRNFQTPSISPAPSLSPESVNEQVTHDSQMSAFDELNSLTGLASVKDEINRMINMVAFNNKRIEQGLKPNKQSLHSVFMGNPGTGKTTVARLMGQVLYEHGALAGDEFIFIEASEPDLVTNNVGGTAIQTLALLESAKGGILFIDEAYTLNKKADSHNFGKEAIETILKYMEDHNEEIMIIFAGYTKQMEEFLRTNPGLESRVPNKLLFEDYKASEIVEMGKQGLSIDNYELESEEYYEQRITSSYSASMDKSNARWIRNFNEQLIKTFAIRASREGLDDLSTINNIDIDNLLDKNKFDPNSDADAIDELNRLIGVQSVKDQVSSFVNIVEVNKKREQQGQPVNSMTLHSLFLGNPGTGKTTVARLLGRAFYQKDIISTNKFIEVSRSDLVGGYQGHTAMKTNEVLTSALGGVLFIDEAYNLYNNHRDMFGMEAINEILKFMEDHRDNIVIIFAGYTKEMTEFLNANSGLESRIPRKFIFDDYSSDEIVQIGTLMLDKQGYTYDTDVYARTVTDAYNQTSDHSNGRWVRNFNERLDLIAANRILAEETNELNVITNEDLQRIREEYHV